MKCFSTLQTYMTLSLSQASCDQMSMKHMSIMSPDNFLNWKNTMILQNQGDLALFFFCILEVIIPWPIQGDQYSFSFVLYSWAVMMVTESSSGFLIECVPKDAPKQIRKTCF